MAYTHLFTVLKKLSDQWCNVCKYSFETRSNGQLGLIIGSRVRWVDPDQQKKKTQGFERTQSSHLLCSRGVLQEFSHCRHMFFS